MEVDMETSVNRKGAETSPIATRLLIGVLALSATPVVVAAQDAGASPSKSGDPGQPVSVEGLWELSAESPMGQFTWTLDLVQDGATVTGTADASLGVFPIEGTLEGDEISLYLEIDEPGHDVALSFVGIVAGDEAAGTVDVHGEVFTWTAVRLPDR